MRDPDQDAADLRREVRRLVEAADHDLLCLLKSTANYGAELDRLGRLEVEPERMIAPILRDGVQVGYLSAPTPTPDPIATARAVAEQAHYALTHREEPSLRVTIPAHYLGEGNHGVRVGTLIEDRHGVSQVQVSGHGVLTVPSKDVQR